MLDQIQIQPGGVPIYVQIRDQMLRAIGARQIRPGEQLPTMREVAVALKVDLNTVKHAYEALAETGAIVIRPARGTFVTEAPPIPDRRELEARVNEIAQRVVAMATAAGADPAQVARAVLQLTQKERKK